MQYPEKEVLGLNAFAAIVRCRLPGEKDAAPRSIGEHIKYRYVHKYAALYRRFGTASDSGHDFMRHKAQRLRNARGLHANQFGIAGEGEAEPFDASHSKVLQCFQPSLFFLNLSL